MLNVLFTKLAYNSLPLQHLLGRDYGYPVLIIAHYNYYAIMIQTTVHYASPVLQARDSQQRPDNAGSPQGRLQQSPSKARLA